MDKSKLLLGIIVAVFLVMIATVVLNGGESTEIEEVNNTTNETVNQTQELAQQTTLIGNNSMGTVSKISSYGNKSSDVRIAFIIGVDEDSSKNNTIIPTLESKQDLNYCYDVYVVNVTSSSVSNSGDDSGLSDNEKSETLANEFVVQDIINNKYNATIDVHSSEGPNSYMFTPVEDAVISQSIIDQISNKVNIGDYMPDSVSYLSTVSVPIVNTPMVEIEYHTNSYYGHSVSEELSTFISILDNFDFNSPIVAENETSTEETSDYVESDSESSESNQEYSDESSSNNESTSSE